MHFVLCGERAQIRNLRIVTRDGVTLGEMRSEDPVRMTFWVMQPARAKAERRGVAALMDHSPWLSSVERLNAHRQATNARSPLLVQHPHEEAFAIGIDAVLEGVKERVAFGAPLFCRVEGGERG